MTEAAAGRGAPGDILETALGHHRAGRLDEAETLYRRFLDAVPEQGDALHLLGILRYQRADGMGAIALLTRAVAADGGQPHYRLALAEALEGAGRFAEAVEHYRAALPNLEDPAEIHFRLGGALSQLGRGGEAIASYRAGLALHPDAAIFNNLGNVLQLAGRRAEAIAAFRRAVGLDPGLAAAQANLGQCLWQEGDAAGAAMAWRALAALEPDRAEVHARLGGALQHLGELDPAEAAFKRAIALQPDFAEAHSNLGVVLKELGKTEEAEATLRRALALDPNAFAALHNLAGVLRERGQSDEAAEFYRRALVVNPDAKKTHYSLGLILFEAGKYAEAEAAYRRALALDPTYAEAHSNLGTAVQLQNRFDEAIACFQQALALKPDRPEPWLNLGLALRVRGRIAEAEVALRLALDLDPGFVRALNGLGGLLRDSGRLDEAEAVLRRAIAADPGSAMAFNNLGNTFKEQGRIDEAIAVYRRALAIDPSFVDAQYNLSLALLAAGVLDEGWRAHESRWRRSDAPPPRRFPQPVWQGEELRGRVLLVWCEQGVGDEITQATMIPDLLRAGARCVLECDKRLVPLFARSFPGAEVVPRCDPPDPRTFAPDIDWQIAGGSLMRWLRLRVDSFPTEPGFLTVNPVRRRLWRDRLHALGPGPKIGLSWMSSLTQGPRAQHFTALADWAPILKRPGVVFVNLQYADYAADIDEARRQFGVTIHGWPDLDLKDDFDGVAALTSALDLVITGPCSVVNIAGAVGVPTWHVWRFPDWEMLGQPSRPFYPGERLFTAAWNRPWPELLAEVAKALGDRLS